MSARAPLRLPMISRRLSSRQPLVGRQEADARQQKKSRGLPFCWRKIYSAFTFLLLCSVCGRFSYFFVHHRKEETLTINLRCMTLYILLPLRPLKFCCLLISPINTYLTFFLSFLYAVVLFCFSTGGLSFKRCDSTSRSVIFLFVVVVGCDANAQRF